jgi:serine O-acetyltransferase
MPPASLGASTRSVLLVVRTAWFFLLFGFYHRFSTLAPLTRPEPRSYLQSQTSQNFQIDIHPNATLGSGIMLDHGTGTVIGSTAVVGDNCSILHHVTLGGSGRKDVDRHPKVGEGCLIGAGSSILGNVRIGNRVQIGAGSLVLEDVDDNAVVVGVPARVVGKVGVEAPAEAMDEVSVLVEGSEFSV